MRLEITCQDRVGITGEVLNVLAQHQIDLRGIELKQEGKIFLEFPSIEFESFKHLMPKMRMIDGVEDVKTTPYMPIQRDRKQIATLLSVITEPCFSIDLNGKVVTCNESVQSSLELDEEQISGTNIGELVEGFNFSKWLDGKAVKPELACIKFIEQEYMADMIPTEVASSTGSILAGALIVLKSEGRITVAVNDRKQPAAIGFDGFCAQSTAMKKMVNEAKALSLLDENMLIYGESGTEKRKIAESCHQNSHRSYNNLIYCDLVGVPEDIIETDLFGTPTRTGKLQLAQGGTLVFDELSELPNSIQRKLQAYLNQKMLVIEAEEPANDIRFISLTNRDMTELVEMGSFSEELYYRLSALPMVVPPLRERRADIVSLSESIVRGQAKKLGVRAPKLSKSCVEYLQGYPWPGNVTQLESALVRALSLINGNEISKEAIQLPYCSATVSLVDDNFEGTLEQEVKRFEKNLLRRLYPSYPSTRQLAKKLGLSHTAIANKLREYGISKATVRY